MNEEVRELILDVRERVLNLKEFGVENMKADLRRYISMPAEAFVPAEAAKLYAALPPPAAAQTLEVSRLSTLPSLAKRTHFVPTASARGGVTPETPETPGSPGPVETPAQPETPETPETPGPAETPERPNLPATPDSPQQPDPPLMLFKSGLPEPVETIEQIRAEIGNCTRCELHTGRTQIVHSAGNFQADLMFVGEAPGADEDEQGFPFVGRAGQLLTKIIEGIGMRREDVFIGNINRCRPPGNRTPVPIETAICRPFLLREVAVVRPKVIVVMGNIATQNLLAIKTPISKLRGHFQDYFGVKVMPTFHPAYLLRDPHKKREVWEDMKMVRDYLKSY